METILTGNQLRFAKVKPNAIIPSKTDENAGYDIYACFDEKYMILEPHTTTLVPTGIASALSDDYYLQVYERGSTGSKGMKYSAGVIDPSYRGEIFIALSNVNNHPIIIAKKEGMAEAETYVREKMHEGLHTYENAVYYPYEKAIAQLVVHKVHKMEIKEISYDELMAITSERGTGALGASGK